MLSDESEISADTVRRLLGGEGHASPKEALVPEEYLNLKLPEAKERFERNYLVQKLREASILSRKRRRRRASIPAPCTPR